MPDKNGVIEFTNDFNKPRSKDFVVPSTPLGSKILIRPRLSMKDGVKIAEPGEKFDLDGYIQASAASTDLAAIIARFEAGDIDAINVNPHGFRGDSTILPKDLFDVAAYKKIYKDAESNFSKLPADIKHLFKDDSAEFFNSVMSGKVNEIMKNYEKSKVQETEPIKKEGIE